jgi:hypothetical protein
VQSREPLWTFALCGCPSFFEDALDSNPSLEPETGIPNKKLRLFQNASAFSTRNAQKTGIGREKLVDTTKAAV